MSEPRELFYQFRLGLESLIRFPFNYRARLANVILARCEEVKDRYKSFDELNRNQKRGRDFQIRVSDRLSATAIIAPHGGGIEPGTSELAEAIAGDEFCFNAFEGIKPRDNCHLHVTSTRFNEPTCVALVGASQNVVAIHGEDSTPEAIFIGGLDDRLRQRISESLRSLKFVVGIHRDRNLHGRDRANICNRSSRGRGVQLELTRGLRKTFFKSLSRSGPQGSHGEI